MYQVLTDWFMLPIKGARKEGVKGTVKGFFMGLGSIVFKPAAGKQGLPFPVKPRHPLTADRCRRLRVPPILRHLQGGEQVQGRAGGVGAVFGEFMSRNRCFHESKVVPMS